MFKRKAYDRLQEWKERSQGRTAVLIEGARRVGKTTLVKCFAQNEYKDYLYIDFSAASKATHDIFLNYREDVDLFTHAPAAVWQGPRAERVTGHF